MVIFTIFMILQVCLCYHQLSANACSEETFVFTNVSSGFITDGPGDYKSNQRCKWLILNPDPDNLAYISLQFIHKDLECSYDYVMVFASNDVETQIVATVSGNALTSPLPIINAHAHNMLIYFYSDVNYELSGFSAMFYVYDCPSNCSGNGKCIENSCVCFHPWIGKDCSESLCPNSCSGNHGDCLFETTKRCTCHDGYLGTGCQISWEGYASSDTWVTVWNHTDDEDIVTNLIGHAGCYVEPYLWVFGGYNLNRVFGHLLRYNFSQNNWEIQHSKTHPTPRYYHTLSSLRHFSYDYLLLFGGEDANKFLNDELWIYNISEMSWHNVENNLKGLILPTAQHAAAVVDFAGDKFFYVFGGKVMQDSEVVLSSAMYRFQWNSSWQLVASDPAGLATNHLQRAGHSMVYDKVAHTLVVFGGYYLLANVARVARSQDLLIFDLDKSFWAAITPLSSSKSDLPKPIAFHTANIIGDYMIIFGGSVHTHETDESCYDNVIYFYHLRCNIWSKRFYTSAFRPSGRHSHVAAVGKEAILLIHGGYNGKALNELLAYKVPVFANKHLPNVCNMYTSNDMCLRDQRCAWMLQEPMCVFKNQSSPFVLVPHCPGLCNSVDYCFPCAIFNSYSLDDTNEWAKVPCTWHVNKVSCLRSDDFYDLSYGNNEKWWNSEKKQLLNSSSQCISSNISPGVLAAFYYDDDASLRPYKVSLVKEKFGIDHNDVPSFIGKHKIVLEGFLHVFTEATFVDVHLQTRNAYGSLYLSGGSNPTQALLRLENPGNLSKSDMAPFVTLTLGNGNRFYYKVIMTYSQEYEGLWAGFLELSWTIQNRKPLGRYSAIKSRFLEPYHSLLSSNLCHTYPDCLSCLLDYSCAWCAGRNNCINRNAASRVFCSGDLADTGSTSEHTNFGVIVDPSSCKMCSISQTCASCLSNSHCSWNSTKGCQPPNAFEQDFQITHLSYCSTPCSSRFTCSDCLADTGADECAWCSSTKHCYNSKYYHLINTFGTCVEWTKNQSNCYDCAAASTCRECTQSIFCGWCSENSSAFQGTCMKGNLVGPDNLTHCPVDTNPIGTYDWTYGHCDVDECSVEWPSGSLLHNCSANAICTDTVMSYDCDCIRGFKGNGFSCEPTCYKDCLHGACGGPPLFECQCDIGWIGNSSNDIDCNTDCQCNFHSTCVEGIGNCDLCKHNTTGSNCELCVDLHYGNASSTEGCQPCQCNGHGDMERGLCDSKSGYCFCLNNTTGENCSVCSPGYYGDPRNGGVCYQECGGRFSNQNGSLGAFGTWNITSKSLFSENLFCMYIISSPENGSIHVKIDKNLNIDCMQTSLLVYDDFHVNSLPLASICGLDLTDDISIYSSSEAECSSAHRSPLNTPTLRSADAGSPSSHSRGVSRRTSAIECARNRQDASGISAGRPLQLPTTIAAGASGSSSIPSESIAQSPSRVLSLPRKTFNIDLDYLQHLLNLKLSMTKIAEILCISRPTLYKIVRDNQLVPKQYSSISNDDLDNILRSIKEEHPSAGEKMIQGHLSSRNVAIQRSRIRESLRRIDAAGISARALSTIRRQQYYVPSPNYLWHIDGTHKLVRWKMVVHMGIDGFSRLIVYGECSSNNKASTVVNLFQKAENNFGLPLRVRSDCGAENALVWQYMYEKRLNHQAVITGSSVHNQRMKRLNRDVNNQVINYYFNLFSYMEDQNIIDPENATDLFALNFLFVPIINEKLSSFVEAWNHHPLSTEGNLTPMQLYVSNLGLFQLQCLDKSAAIDPNDIEIRSSPSQLTFVDVEPPRCPLCPEELVGLEGIINQHSNLKEIPLYKRVAEYIAECLLSRS